MSMEIAKLYKSAYNNQLQQSIYLCHKRNMSQIWQMNTLWESQTEADTGFSKRGSVGCRGHEYFILGTFRSGTYHVVHRQMVGGQNTGGQNASQNSKEDKMQAMKSALLEKCPPRRLPSFKFEGVENCPPFLR